jgi:RHS repeat-associated protein
MTNRTSLAENNSYSYDLKNRLSTALIGRTDAGHQLVEAVSYTYDAKGTRVRVNWTRSVDGGAQMCGTNIFVNEPNSAAGISQVLEELPYAGALPSVSYTLGSRVLSQSRGGVVSHFMPDGHGSMRQLADSSGGIAARYTYDGYGRGLDFTNWSQSPAATEILYSGEQHDPDLQMYNLRARYYNPAAGRFGQGDPFSPNQQGGMNLYTYCADDPVNSADPSGLYEIDVHEYLTRFLAQALGYTNAISLGRETQRLDEDERSAMIGLRPNYTAMFEYHFVSREQLSKLAGHMSPQGPDRVVGEFLHAQEDTYAHSTGAGNRDWYYYGNLGLSSTDTPFLSNGGFIGHAWYGHQPDFTWNDPVKALWMARRVYEDLKYTKAHGGMYDPNEWIACTDPPDPMADNSDPVWNAIRARVYRFLVFVPQTANYYGVQTVTQEGYTSKIRALFPGFNPTAGVDDFLMKKKTRQEMQPPDVGVGAGDLEIPVF